MNGVVRQAMKLTFDKIMEGKGGRSITRGPIPCKCPRCGGILKGKKVKGSVRLYCVGKECVETEVYCYKRRGE